LLPKARRDRPLPFERIKPYFPLSHGVPRVDDRRVVSGIIHVIRNGLRWRDAPEVYGPHKTLYNRFARWSRMGVFARIFSNLVADDEPPDCLMIDSTHLKAHRTAARVTHPVVDDHPSPKFLKLGVQPTFRAPDTPGNIPPFCRLTPAAVAR
jgi:putative transposase